VLLEWEQIVGVYYSQALTVSGPKDDFNRFLDVFFTKDASGQPAGIAIDRVAPAPDDILPEEDWRDDYVTRLALFTIASVTDSAIRVRFSMKGAHVGPLVRTVGKNCPTLTFRLAVLDDVVELPYVATCAEGAFSEAYVELTEAFVVEVEGRPREPSPEWTQPSVIRRWPVTHIRYWLAQHKVMTSLPGYPVYEPAFPGYAATLTHEQADANLERFMNTRAQRIDQLRGFLGRFQLTLDTSDAGLRKLDRWIARYGAFLAVRETGPSFYTFLPAWRDERLGQNVILDLATFIGEVVIERNPGLYWEVYRAVPIGARKGDPHYQTLAIRSPDPRMRRIWPLHISQTCRWLRERCFMWRRPSWNVRPQDALTKAASHMVAQARETTSRLRSPEEVEMLARAGHI
jgi:hypothetical protein